MCERCDRYQATCEALKQENEALKERIRKTQDFCTRVVTVCREVLNQKSGVPRGKWAYAKAAAAIAGKVLKLMNSGVM